MHPTAKDLPSEDPVVQGTVVLWLPKKRTLTGLTVRMQGRYDISWGDMRPFEAGTSLDREVTLLHPGEDVHLDKGEHRFEVRAVLRVRTVKLADRIFSTVRDHRTEQYTVLRAMLLWSRAAHRRCEGEGSRSDGR